jgi:alpha-ketoglutarate-dependent taurine dioxygenase
MSSLVKATGFHTVTKGLTAGTVILFMKVSDHLPLEDCPRLVSTGATTAYPPGYTHLHQDTVPEVGGDTLWASGYAAYDKLSPKFQSLIDGLK